MIQKAKRDHDDSIFNKGFMRRMPEGEFFFTNFETYDKVRFIKNFHYHSLMFKQTYYENYDKVRLLRSQNINNLFSYQSGFFFVKLLLNKW
jgi:hypothetical protein